MNRIPPENRSCVAGTHTHNIFQIFHIQTIFALTWNQPFSIVITGIPEIFLNIIREGTVFWFIGCCLKNDIVTPASHTIILLSQDICISCNLIHRIRNNHSSIPPAGRSSGTFYPIHHTHQFAHRWIISILRNYHGNNAILILITFHIVQPTGKESGAVFVQKSCSGIDKHISCPSCFFPLRAVCRHRKHISALRPSDIFVETIQTFI